MFLKRLMILLLLLVALTACGPVAPPQDLLLTEPPVVDQTVEPTAPPASTEPERPLAAKVNGEPIYLVDYERQIAQYQDSMIASGVDLASAEGQERLLQARQEILNWMIEQVLIEQAAAEMGINVTDAEVEESLAQIVQDAGGEDAFQAQLERNGLTREDVWRELRAELISAAVIEQVIAAVPERSEHVHARHILVDTREEAEQILAQLQAGADFGELARTHSKDESTRAAGGDLGFFPRGVLLAPEVEEAAFNLQAGQISGVVESSFGFHVVQTLEVEPDMALSADIQRWLRDQAVEDWREALWAQATVEVYANQSP